MRTPIAIAIACIAAVLTVDAAPTQCIKSHKVVAGDSCASIAKKAGITSAKLISYNTSLNSKCSNLKVGEVLCVSKKVATTKRAAKAATTKKTTKKTTTHKATTKKTTTTHKITTKKATTTKKTTTTKKATIIKKPVVPTTTAKKTTTTTKKATATKTTTTTATATPTLNYTYGLVADVKSKDDFCMFLPSSPGNMDNNSGKTDIDAIANSEKSAVAFCLLPNNNAAGARLFPDGFIKSAHFFHNTTAQYVQVTGKFNPTAYSLSVNDYGGQYDNHGAGSPPSSMCYGYRYYVNMIEPNKPDYCIRCCNSYTDCNAGRSSYGCHRVVDNGNYN